VPPAGRPGPPEFVVDRSLPAPTIVEVFRGAGLTVHTLADVLGGERHARDAEDEQWIAEAAARRLFVLTEDQRIRRRPAQRRALAVGRVGAFCLASGDLSLAEMRAVFLADVPRIVAACGREETPFLFALHAGRLERLSLR
jgi:PIN like domain